MTATFWPTQEHWSVKIPLHTPHVRLDCLSDTGFVEQVDADLLKHPCANAREHILAGLALQNHGVNAGLVQQLTEQQARGAGTDDGEADFPALQSLLVHCVLRLRCEAAIIAETPCSRRRVYCRHAFHRIYCHYLRLVPCLLLQARSDPHGR